MGPDHDALFDSGTSEDTDAAPYPNIVVDGYWSCDYACVPDWHILDIVDMGSAQDGGAVSYAHVRTNRDAACC
jgi:hypothetical protein